MKTAKPTHRAGQLATLGGARGATILIMVFLGCTSPETSYWTLLGVKYERDVEILEEIESLV